MDSVHYKDFNNICRICLLKCDNKFFREHVILDIYNKLSDGIPFEADDELPQQICGKCFEKIDEINTFGARCKQSHSALMKCLNEFKNVRIKEEQDSELMQIKEELTNDDHQLEVIDDAVQRRENTENNVENPGEEMPNANQNNLQVNEDAPCNRQYDFDHFLSIFTMNNICLQYPQRRPKRPFFRCDICNKTFCDSRSVNRHKLLHRNERPYLCNLCPKKYIDSAALHQHKKRVHYNKPLPVEPIKVEPLPVEPLKVEPLPVEPLPVEPLKVELLPVEPPPVELPPVEPPPVELPPVEHPPVVPEEKFSCDICDKEFFNLGALKYHKRLHAWGHPYVCDICRKSFKNTLQYKIHERLHTTERPYACDICNKDFKNPLPLQIHKRKHKYKCDVCKREFKIYGGLMNHKCKQSDGDGESTSKNTLHKVE